MTTKINVNGDEAEIDIDLTLENVMRAINIWLGRFKKKFDVGTEKEVRKLYKDGEISKPTMYRYLEQFKDRVGEMEKTIGKMEKIDKDQAEEIKRRIDELVE